MCKPQNFIYLLNDLTILGVHLTKQTIVSLKLNEAKDVQNFIENGSVVLEINTDKHNDTRFLYVKQKTLMILMHSEPNEDMTQVNIICTSVFVGLLKYNNNNFVD